MKRLVLVTIITALSSLGHTAENAQGRLNQNKTALCQDRDSNSDADCYDPVSYLKNQKAEKVGLENSKKFRTEYKGANYVFSSQDHLDLFKKNPEEFLPQFGGWCAYAVAKNKSKVDIDPASFVVQDGKLLLFYNGFLNDTRKKWLHTEGKSPANYLSDATSNWPSVENKEP